MFCHSCGTEAKAGANYCERCGIELNVPTRAAKPRSLAEVNRLPPRNVQERPLERRTNWVLEGFKKYAVFRGRARRKEFWYFTLFNYLIIFALFAVAAVFDASEQTAEVLVLVYVFAVVLPIAAVQVRRLHDRGLSGWWIFLNSVPYVGSLTLFVIYAIDGEAGPNAYGPDPKEKA